jgi:hypothetical protein
VILAAFLTACLVSMSPREFAPDGGVVPAHYEGLLGAFLFELQPMGAALVELFGGEGEDGVAVDE